MKRPWMLPAVPLYVAGNWLDRSLARPRQLGRPVVSVGSISAGGAGKTPFILELARLFTERGIAVDVLSRGYKRQSREAVRVDPAGSAAEFGDEPLLVARRTGVPVYVAAQRFAAGQLAEEAEPAPALHLLDDGFQHYALARDLDLVLLTASDLKDALLPAGDRREPFSALRRADIFVLREEEVSQVEPVLRRKGFSQPIWLVRRTLSLPTVGGPAIAFCGIARPEVFFAGLRGQGVELAETVIFPDHHSYTPEDGEHLADLAKKHRAAAILCTDKDLVKFSGVSLYGMRTVAPVHVVGLRAELLEPQAALDSLLQCLDLHL